MQTLFKSISQYLSLVKFSHTIFAMPFALIGFTMAVKLYEKNFRYEEFIFVLLCMIFARNAAMGFNRYVDRNIDAANPRTSGREIPSGAISPGKALVFVLANALGFILAAGMINKTCLYLSPLALLIILGYSFTKRFTFLCHYVLGLGLALAPVGAFIAITDFFAVEPIVLGIAVLFWVSGFDIIYALQDETFDRSQKLHSVPERFGIAQSLWIARIGHLMSILFLGYFCWLLIEVHQVHMLPVLAAFTIFLVALISQHRLVGPHDLSRVNLAFFTANGLASLAFGGVIIAALLLK